jgi:hypothetical protein
MNSRVGSLLFSFAFALPVLALEAAAQPRPTAAALSPANVVRTDGTGFGQGVPSCLAHRGCPAPRALPACAAGVTAEPVERFWARRNALRGRAVAVRGTLTPQAGCTEMACVNTCCNGCHGSLALTGGGQTLALGVEGEPAFACDGDDSGLCCGTQVPAGAVVVTGTLVGAPRNGGMFRLQNPTLCRMP